MTNLRSFISTLILIFSLVVGPFLLSTEAVAQNEVLSQAAISQFTANLERARNIQAEIGDRVLCIEARDKELISQRAKLEIGIGEIRLKEQTLASKLAVQDDLYKSYSAIYDSEMNTHNKLEEELRVYQNQKWSQEEAVRICKNEWYTINAFCDLAMEITKLVGLIESVEGKIASTTQRLNSARDAKNEAQQRLNESEKELVLVKQQLEQSNVSVRQMENEISTLKITLSNLRSENQNDNILFDNFENALKEAKSVDTADARARTARKVILISEKVDNALKEANSILPPGWRQSCSAR